MSISELELFEKLTRSISQGIPAAFGDGFELAPTPPVRLYRRYSFMFRYWLKTPQGETRPLLAKIPHESWMRTLQEAVASEHLGEVVQNEYQSLISIVDAVSASGRTELFALRPVAIFPDLNALLMEEIPLKMLKTTLSKPGILLGSKREWQAFETQLKRAGEWLKVIHAHFSKQQTATLKNLKMSERIDTELKHLEGFLARPLPDLRNLVSRLSDLLETVEIPLSCLHDDYQLGNIFMTTDGRIGALDPHWVEEGAVYKDLASLMIDPVTRKIQVLTIGATFRPSLQKRYKQAVLQGYFDNPSSADPILYFYCAHAALVKWREDEELLKTGGSRIYTIISVLLTPLIRMYFHKLVHTYLLQGVEAHQALQKKQQA